MRRILIIVSVFASVLLGSSAVSSAQGKYGPDSTKCIEYLSYYTEYYKQKNYESALPNWRQAYKYCPPTSRYNLLSNGTTLLKGEIKKYSANPIRKAQLVDSLLVLYDQIAQYWPKYAVSNLNKKALDMYNFKQGEPEFLYKEFTDIIEQTQSETSPNIFPIYMKIACDLYQEGDISAENVINAYENSVKYLGEKTPKNETEGRLIAKNLDDIEKLFIGSQVASCENLVELFTPRYEADPQNLSIAKTIVNMMIKTEGCTDNDLFVNAMQTWYELEPSHTSAYNLYKLYSSRGDVENAVKFMEEAIASEQSDADTDADYNVELAAFCYKNNNNARAVKAAQDAVELSDLYDGKAYMLLGTIWGSLVCSGNDIEQRAKYWVAVDYMNKAKAADETLAEDASNLIRQYSAYFPQTAEAFMYGVEDGQSYTVSCGGLRATTIVRTQK